MKKKFKVEGLCCANCAAKLEEKINELPNVENAVISIITQRFYLETPDECFDEVLEKVKVLFSKIDSGAKIIQ